MHRFTIDYTDGLTVINTMVDNEMIDNNGETHYMVKTYINHSKIRRSLKTHPDQLGITATIEELVLENNKTLITTNNCTLGNWMMPTLNRNFIPYIVEIYYNAKLVFTDVMDCKFKLVNFTLNPKDVRELYVWMNVIEKFKREMQCNISIKNDIVYSTTEFDNFVDVKFEQNDPNKQYYLGLNVGRYYQPNSQTPDFFYHPDGLHNKNSLDIINDILYHHCYII